MESELLHFIVDITSILGSLSLVVSVLLLFRELRQSNRLTRAANTQTLVSLSSPYYIGLIQDRTLAQLYHRGSHGVEEMDEVDQYRYKTMIVWWLIFHENVFYQWRLRLLDGRSFKPWVRDLEMFVSRHNLADSWPSLRELFQDDFARHVDRLIAQGQGHEAPAAADYPSGGPVKPVMSAAAGSQ